MFRMKLLPPSSGWDIPKKQQQRWLSLIVLNARSNWNERAIGRLYLSAACFVSISRGVRDTHYWLLVECHLGTHRQYMTVLHIGRFTHSMRAHAVPLPCRAAKGLECVFPIWFTQCGLVWFTLAMPRPYHVLTMPFFPRPRHGTARHGRRETDCGLPARVRLLPATTRTSTKIVIRSIPILLTTIHTYNLKEW